MIKKLIKILIPILCVALCGIIVALCVMLSFELRGGLTNETFAVYEELPSISSSADESGGYYFYPAPLNQGYYSDIVSMSRTNIGTDTHWHNNSRFYLNTPLSDIVSFDFSISALGKFTVFLSGMSIPFFEVPNGFIDGGFLHYSFDTPFSTQFLRFFCVSQNVTVYECTVTFNLSNGSSYRVVLVENPVAWSSVKQLYSDVYNIGYTSGHNEGYESGHDDGYTNGYNQGYENGYYSNAIFVDELINENLFVSGHGEYYALKNLNLFFEPGEYRLYFYDSDPPFDTYINLMSGSSVFLSIYLDFQIFGGEFGSTYFAEFSVPLGGVHINRIAFVTDANPYGEHRLYGRLYIISGNGQEYEIGYNTGYDLGYSDGFGVGDSTGYRYGYDDGYAVKIDEINGISFIASIANGVFTSLNVNIFGFFSIGDLLYVGVIFMIFKFAMRVMN